MKDFSHSLTMGETTWHAKWYRHYLSLGGIKPEGKENLCHYIKVLFLLAPLRWFFKGKTKKGRPHLGLAILALLASAIIIPMVLWPVATLEGLGFYLGIPVVGSIAFMGALVLVISRFEDLEKRRKDKGKEPNVFKAFTESAADTGKLMFSWFSTKKNGSRVCPFIEFEESESEPSPS